MVWFRWLERKDPSLRLGGIPLVPHVPALSWLALPYSVGPTTVRTHWHVMGLSGFGKSKLLASMASQLILQGRPVAVIDPHSDLAHDVLRLLLEHGYYHRSDAMARVLYVTFAHPTRFVPFNVLAGRYPPYEIARNLVEAATRAWPTLSGGAAPQFENLLLSAATVLIHNQLPLTALSPLLINADYRARLLQQVHDDPQVVEFFTHRYETGRGTGALNESTLRRAFLLTYPPPLRYSLGQRENLLDARALMDRRVSLICDLGGLDAQTQRILGCLLTVGFETAALSRADLPPAARSPYWLFVDEFSQFAAQSGVALERVLAQARKYGLYLVLAHQTWSQVEGGLQGALQNSTFVSFRLGPQDVAWGAERVALFNPYRIKEVLPATMNRPARTVYFTKSELRAQWEYSLQTLRKQEAILRARGRTVMLHTTTVSPPTRAVQAELDALLACYAEALQTPKDVIEQGWQQPERDRARVSAAEEDRTFPASAGAPVPAPKGTQRAWKRVVPLE